MSQMRSVKSKGQETLIQYFLSRNGSPHMPSGYHLEPTVQGGCFMDTSGTSPKGAHNSITKFHNQFPTIGSKNINLNKHRRD